MGATFCAKLLALPMSDALMLTVAGTVGGILPDVDLKVSWPSRLLFGLLGGVAGLVWLFAHLERLTALELWLAALGIYLVVRYPVHTLFHTLTVHRGALHSLAAALMAGLVTSAVGSRLLGVDAASSWLLGAFVAAGYVLHLTLDEIYSVDFAGVRIRRSFGSALKPVDLERWPATCAVLATAALAWFWTPELAPFLDAWTDLGVRWRGTLLPSWILGG